MTTEFPPYGRFTTYGDAQTQALRLGCNGIHGGLQRETARHSLDAPLMNTRSRIELTALHGLASEAPFAPAAVLSHAAALLGIAIPDPRWAESLALVKRHVQFTRRTVHAGEPVQVAGQSFMRLHVVNSGVFKTETLAHDGREQIVGLHFKGDWIGLDGMR
jgi:hypothetical protein